MYTGQLDEIDSDYRRTGEPPNRMVASSGSYGYDGYTIPDLEEHQIKPYAEIPICFVQRYNLRSELVGSGKPKPDAVLRILTAERGCDTSEDNIGFVTWQQGSTPKEHREMLDRQWMIAREDRRDAEMRARRCS
jgi:hypothetical protein